MPRSSLPGFRRCPGSPKDLCFYVRENVCAGRIEKNPDCREWLATVGNASKLCWSMREAKAWVMERVARQRQAQ